MVTERDWVTVVRIGAVVAGIGLLIVSGAFSIRGLAFELGQDEMIVISAFILAMVIFVLELILNQITQLGLSANWTLAIAGIAAYAYGVWSNYLGLVSYRGGDDQISGRILLILAATAFEILPEPMIAFGLVGTGVGDIIGNLFGKSKGGSPMPQGAPFRPSPDKH